MTNRLGRLGLEIARGYLSRDQFGGYSVQEKEDILGAWSVQFVKNWSNLDPEANPHSYITTIVRNCWRMYERSTQRRLRREHAKAEEAYFEQMNSISRFVRYHANLLGNFEDVLSAEEFHQKISGGIDKGNHE